MIRLQMIIDFCGDHFVVYTAAAAKSLQSCPTLCDPIDSSLPGSPVPGTLQTRTLEWVAISCSNAWKWKNKVKSLSCVRLLATPWTAAYQAPPLMGFARQEYWSGVPLPSPFVVYTNIVSLCCTPETSTMWYANCNQRKVRNKAIQHKLLKLEIEISSSASHWAPQHYWLWETSGVFEDQGPWHADHTSFPRVGTSPHVVSHPLSLVVLLSWRMQQVQELTFLPLGPSQSSLVRETAREQIIQRVTPPGPHSSAEVLAPNVSECHCFWTKGLLRDKGKMRCPK